MGSFLWAWETVNWLPISLVGLKWKRNVEKSFSFATHMILLPGLLLKQLLPSLFNLLNNLALSFLRWKDESVLSLTTQKVRRVPGTQRVFLGQLFSCSSCSSVLAQGQGLRQGCQVRRRRETSLGNLISSNQQLEKKMNACFCPLNNSAAEKKMTILTRWQPELPGCFSARLFICTLNSYSSSYVLP